MGGRSSSSAGRGSGGGVTKVGNIDLRDSPLRYGSKDKHFSNATRKQLDDFESKASKASVENQIMLDENGNVIVENVGNSKSVGYSHEDAKRAKTTSHNHPRDDNRILGGTFSVKDPEKYPTRGDMNGFVFYENQGTKRATAQEGTYSISKGDNFDGNSFLREYYAATQRFKKEARSEASMYDKKYASTDRSTYSKEQYKSDYRKLNNRQLVKMHNWLLDNQSRFGYYYTLEKRR